MTTHATHTPNVGASTGRRALVVPQSAAFRWSASIVTALVGLTAVAGGLALVVGFEADLVAPATSVLAGSGFSSFLVPGLLLAIVVGGTQLAAAVLAVVRSRWTVLAVTIAAVVLLVWIFVETALIPWSVLQALYFAVGLGEIGLVLVGLGLLSDGRRR
jgi:hypothetical protein